MAAFAFHRLTLTLFSIFLIIFSLRIQALQVSEAASGLKVVSEALQWPPVSMSMYTDLDESGDFDDGLLGLDDDDDDDDDDEDGVDVDVDGGEMGRRSLFWWRRRYYISYGALSANRIPCPPRSGRSYYTHNCFKARAPVNPYTRGCSRITRCRR